MCTRCAERRAALHRVGRAVLRADAKAATQSARAIGRSLAADARALAARLSHPARRP